MACSGAVGEAVGGSQGLEMKLLEGLWFAHTRQKLMDHDGSVWNSSKHGKLVNYSIK